MRLLKFYMGHDASKKAEKTAKETFEKAET